MTLTWEGLKVPTPQNWPDTATITDPNLYADIVDFGGHTWRPRIKITNNEGQDLYFQVKPRPGATQPARYTIATTNLGMVANGNTTEFTNWEGITCTKTNAPAPSDIPSGGTLSETVYLRLEAYTDPNYTTSFGYADFDITLIWIDSSSAGWTVVDTDTFDDGTYENWYVDGSAGANSAYGYSINPDAYRSPPYSLSAWQRARSSILATLQLYKTFDMGTTATRGFVVLYIRRWVQSVISYYPDEILIDGSVRYKFFAPFDKFFKLVLPFPSTGQHELRIRLRVFGDYPFDYSYTSIWIDNVKVIKS